MNEKIIAMVGRSPGIKTGQIADQLDVSFEEAQEKLQALVLANQLTGELVPLAGGGKVMAYHVLGHVREQPTERAPIAAPQPFGKPPVEPKPRRPYVRTSPVTMASAQEVGLPSAPTAAPAPAERAYRCAVWLDGKVEIHKGGYRVLLTNDELAEIVAFVAERRAA